MYSKFHTARQWDEPEDMQIALKIFGIIILVAAITFWLIPESRILFLIAFVMVTGQHISMW